MSTPQGSVIVKPHSREDMCLAPPQPELRRRLLSRYHEIKDSQASSREHSVLGTILRPVERRRPGLNDGLVRPSSTFSPGTSVASQLASSCARLRGDVNVIVVMVEFSDCKFSQTQTKEHFRNVWFKENSNSVRDYFRDVSNGLVTIKGEVAGPFLMPKTLKQYANGAYGFGNPPNAATMARDAAALVDPVVNFKPYDNDKDGYVDAFVIVHAGTGAEASGDPNDIWSHKWVLENGAYQSDCTQVYAYLTVPADCKLGVCVHELGHLAFRWPDLYDTDYSSFGIGNWCLMSFGCYNGNSDNPAAPNAWCKMDQGWVDVVAPTRTQQVNLRDVKDGRQVLQLWKDGMAPTEYFLLENRERKGRDADLPAQGLLLWHIDELKPDNRDETHYKVALMQSDGEKDLENREDFGDDGDPYPGVKGVRFVDATTNPSTNTYNGAHTGLEIRNISNPADVMTFTVVVGPSGRVATE